MRDALYSIGGTKYTLPYVENTVNWSPDFKHKLIGSDLKLSISPENGPKQVIHSNPTLASIQPLLQEMKEPSLLLLRGCDKLLLPITDFPFQKFKTLTSLEISGVAHLTQIPEHTFSGMNQLESLNLSHLPIHDLPDQLFAPLSSLRSLLIKDCSGLYSVPRVRSKLEYLELSHLPIQQLDDSFLPNDVDGLSWVIFRGCSKLRRIPPFLEKLETLEVLDVSHCTVLESWGRGNPNPEFISSRLKMLDFSYSPFCGDSLPVTNIYTLTHLFLRGTKLDNFEAMVNNLHVQVLDFSGAQNMRNVNWTPLNVGQLQVLDFSRTDIESINSVSHMFGLRSLLLRKCTRLVYLPELFRLKRLEVLDMSGCESIVCLPEDLPSLRKLKELDLSGCSRLRDCLFDQISSLEKLDLSKTQFNHFRSFSNLTNLLVLNLSRTSIAEVVGVSELVNLKELLLGNCERLQVLPDVRALVNLETLDLSLPDGYTITHSQVEAESHPQRDQFFADPTRLQKLVLTHRPGVLDLFPEVSPDNLLYLDLRGIDVIGVHSTGNGNLEEAGDIHPRLVQRQISNCDELHLVSTFLSWSSGCDRFMLGFNALEKHVLNIQKKFRCASTATNKGKFENEVFKRQYRSIDRDLEYIRTRIIRLQNSGNREISEKLLHELLVVAYCMNESPRDLRPQDYTKLHELLRIIAKLKLLVPRGPEEIDHERSPKLNSYFQLQDNMIFKEREIQEAFNSLEGLQRNCLFYFLYFSSLRKLDRGKGGWVQSSIQNRILIQWWISEGLINASASKTAEEMGKQILSDLEHKKLINPYIRGDMKSRSSCMVPSVHSFVTQRAEEEGFFDCAFNNDDLPPHMRGSQRVCLLKSPHNFPSSCRLYAVSALLNINETMIDTEY